MNAELIAQSLPLLFKGLVYTVGLALFGMAMGLLLGLGLALMRLSRSHLLRWPAGAYISAVRGTPLLVQLFIIYYGAAQWEWLKNGPAWVLFSEAWFCALLAFTLNTGAYTAEIVRGAVLNMPKGQIEAANAFGMSRWQTLTRIILPNSFRRALPAYSNEVIFMLQGSAVAGIITIVDLTGAARIINSRYYSPFEAFLTAGLLYMLLTFAIVWLFKKWEARWHAHLRPRSV